MNKKDLQDKATKLGVTFVSRTSVPELEALIAAAEAEVWGDLGVSFTGADPESTADALITKALKAKAPKVKATRAPKAKTFKRCGTATSATSMGCVAPGGG